MAGKPNSNPLPTPQGGLPPTTNRAIRLPEVISLTGQSRTAVYDGVRAKTFPSGFLLSPKRRAWLLSEVMDWLYDRAKAGV